MHFPVSGVDVSPIVPFLTALVVSTLTSMGGVSGAFLLLPFQVSVLHYTSPSVSATNHVYNVVAIPGGLYRYIREKRMAWPLTWTIILGTLPGVVIGAVIRIRFLPDPRNFKFFVGGVLAFIGARLLIEAAGLKKRNERLETLEKQFQEEFAHRRAGAGTGRDVTVRTLSVSAREVVYEFYGEKFSFRPASLLALSFIVGIVGGAYGIGGGAIIAPFVIAFYELPVYTVAGAALMGTFVTSIVGILTFYALDYFHTGGGSLRPDLLLGALFGAGGLIGTYLGARIQKFVPGKVIRAILAVSICALAFRYVWEYFFK